MKTYQSIRSAIAKLEKEAAALRAREVAEVIAKIKPAIAEYGLTAADLGFTSKAGAAGRAAKGKKARRARPSAGVPQYRDPETGATWTGRGRPPAWILGVKDREALRISAFDEAARPAKTPGTRAGASKRSAMPKSPARKGAAKKTTGKRSKAPPAVKTPAVEIESGVAAG